MFLLRSMRGKTKIIKQNTLARIKIVASARLIALFLCLLFISSIVTANYGSIVFARPKQIVYPGPTKATVSKLEAAADARPSSTEYFNESIDKKFTQNEPLQGLSVAESSKQKHIPHEIVDERTARTTTSLNSDGSITRRQYFSPKFFKQNNQWKDIDTTLIEDKNAGGAGNIFGKALGEAQSWFGGTETFKVKANDWQARFAPSNDSVGMVRIEKYGSSVSFSPKGAADVVPIVLRGKDGHQIVHYANLWRGVDVEYVIETDAIKENIIIRDKNATNTVSFKLTGAKLAKHQLGSNKELPFYDIKGALGEDFSIAPANLVLNNYGFVSEDVFSQKYEDNTITVAVSKEYLKSLPAKAFPAVIDPTTFVSNFGDRWNGNYISFKSDGYVCNYTQCNVYAGSLYNANNNLVYWRGAFYAPYDQFRNTSNVLTNATIHLKQRSNESFWTGDWGTHNYQIGHATCLSGFNCVDGIWASGNIASEGDINVTSLYQNMISQGDFGGWIMVMGEDGTDHSFKNFDPGLGGTSGSYVSFTYAGVPSAPPLTTPSNGQVFVDVQPSLSFNAIPNPNGATPLRYELVVSTGMGASGTVVSSNLMDATQWTVPDGVLQDGMTYYAQVRSFDPITSTYSQWGASVPFRIDLRTGKDKTQAYDTFGAVSVDLATGNTTTSNTTHSSSALGGNMGISMDYNTPLRSRNGLVGEYWNNATFSGNPLFNRVDKDVNFDWANGSPSSGTIPNDNFSVRWKGYFIAPVTATYQFGGSNDENMSISVFGNLQYNQTCSSGICYDNTKSIYLESGQIVPIQIEYKDTASLAYAKVYVKASGANTVSEKVIPSEWLETGVRPTATTTGLIGHYYARNDGTNTFSAAIHFF